MNANELADSLMGWADDVYGGGETLIEAATMLRQQQAEIEALNELNTMLKDAIEKRIGLDAERYKWLRAEFAAGRETYLAEGMPSGESLDKYIDENFPDSFVVCRARKSDQDIPLYTHPVKELEPKIKRACKKCIEQQTEIEALKAKLKLNDEILKPMLIDYIKSNLSVVDSKLFFIKYDSVRKAQEK